MNRKTNRCCENCSLDEDICMYPYYGVAPHDHNFKKSGGSFIGSTEIRDRSEWPANFTTDPEDEGAGVYEYCLTCRQEEAQ